MISKQEFFFVRHGQTNHNLLKGSNKGDHTHEIPLNETGRNQAKQIEPIIATLPIKTICSSPMIRVQETKEIITPRLFAPHKEIDHLGECTAQVWAEMAKQGMYAPMPNEGIVHSFMTRVREGINQALTHPGPVLIVAHGGVHWATCCLMGIKDHAWAIDNCAIVHFSIRDDGAWTAKKLNHPL